MDYNDNINKDISNYAFVQFIKPETFIADSKKRFSGYIEIELLTVDKLFIGSGMSYFDGTTFYATTLQENGKLIIPGSSLKGAVRHISRAVSPSCIPDTEEDQLRNEYHKECILNEQCIVCDMFGMMSKASKIRFTDLISENGKTVKVKVPPQFEPQKHSEKYKDDHKFFGYKFYYTNCKNRDIPKDESIEAIMENTSFTGKVFFKDLYKEELQLLMFALSFSEHISLKLGKYKADGFGTCNIFCKKLLIDGKEEDVKKAYDYAIAHKEYVDKIAKGQINNLSDILLRKKYKEELGENKN